MGARAGERKRQGELVGRVEDGKEKKKLTARTEREEGGGKGDTEEREKTRHKRRQTHMD